MWKFLWCDFSKLVRLPFSKNNMFFGFFSSHGTFLRKPLVFMPKSFLRKWSASNYLANDVYYHTFWEKFFLSDCEAMEQELHWPTGALKNGGHIFIMSTQVFLRPETLLWHFQLVSLVNSKISTALYARDWTICQVYSFFLIFDRTQQESFLVNLSYKKEKCNVFSIFYQESIQFS